MSRLNNTISLDIELLLAHVLDKPRSYLYAYPNQRLTTEQRLHFECLWKRRLRGEPIAYILGKKMFWKDTFYVNRACLIPRPETETLLEVVLKFSTGDQPLRALELGTGSGALALSLAKERPHWTIVAVDCSPEALAVAKTNALRLGINNVVFYLSDWFKGIDHLRSNPFDVILGNPPYVSEDDPRVWEGDVCFEPRSALIATCQGMGHLKHIVAHAPYFLSKNGYLALEHGYNQGCAMRHVLQKHGYADVTTYYDIDQLTERVTTGILRDH